MKGQTRITVPVQPSLPAIPVEFHGSADVTYTRHRVHRRDHCSVCIWLLHHHSHAFSPRVATYRRRAADAGHELEEDALLCVDHRFEWRQRDNPVRVAAGLKPW